MGDDAELYWEMEHDPFFWDQVEINNGDYSMTKTQNRKSTQRKRVHKKKENTVLYIDGENISSKKAEQILEIAKKQGVLGTKKVYGLQKDVRTKSWSDEAKDLGIKDIRLFGNPEKDKVDKKIQKDTREEVQNNKSVDIVCIATSDKGYTETVKELRKNGKRVVVIGEKKAPRELREACNEFIEIR